MKIQLNLDSLAVLLFVEIWLLIIQPLFSQRIEWYNVERKLKSSTKKRPSKLFGMNKDTLIDILGIEEYIAYKMIARLSTINELYLLCLILKMRAFPLLQNMKIIILLF